MRRCVFVVFILALNLSFSLVVQARSHRELTYHYSKIWSTMVRFLRVDNRFTISEKDKKAGYVLFEYRESGPALPASVELISTVRDGKRYIRASLRISSMPSYVEVVLLDKFLRKLRRDYGDPPPPRLVKKGSSEAKEKYKKNSAKDAKQGNEPPESEEDIEADEADLEKSQQE